MNFSKSTTLFKQAILIVFLLSFPFLTFSQNTDSTKAKIEVHGAISATNNGISVIPSFNLGKPAAIFDLVVRKKRLSFEPQFRFAFEDFKPWSFVFWMRYRLVQTEKYKVGIGAHPSTVFSSTSALVNGTPKDLITVKRYWAGEIAQSYALSKNVSVSLYYLYALGLADAIRNTNFLQLGINFSNIKLNSAYYLKFSPQIYYLQMDANTGYYATTSLTLANRKSPFSISSVMNKKIRSAIPSKDFLWNISLAYSF